MKNSPDVEEGLSDVEAKARAKARKYGILSLLLGILVVASIVVLGILVNGYSKKLDDARKTGISICQALEAVSDTSYARFLSGETNAALFMYLRVEENSSAVEMKWTNPGGDALVLQIDAKGEITTVDWGDGFRTYPANLKPRVPWQELFK